VPGLLTLELLLAWKHGMNFNYTQQLYALYATITDKQVILF